MADQNENIEKNSITPSYASDEINKDGFVRVRVMVKGLKTSTDITFKGFLPKANKKPENANIDVLFEDRSFCLTVSGESGDLKWKTFQLKIKQLPREIIAEKSFYQVEKDRVVLYLCKSEDRSWYPQMRTGLETAEMEDD